MTRALSRHNTHVVCASYPYCGCDYDGECFEDESTNSGRASASPVSETTADNLINSKEKAA